MKQVTVKEKYNAVNEGKMAKGEFVRQMRIAYPTVISQWDNYSKTVQTLKSIGHLEESTGEKVYDSRMELNISSNSIDRGVRYELQGMGHDPANCSDKELVAKVTDRVIKNLKKDPLHYINLLAKESSHVDKHDKEVEVKRGEAQKDVFNGEKKADLKEGVEEINVAGHEIDKSSEKLNIVNVARPIRAKYGDIPGFTSILKDFLQTHMDDVKSGKVTDPIAEFDDFIDVNYDRLDETEEEVNELSSDAVDALIGVIGAGGLTGGAVALNKLLSSLESGKFGERGKAVAKALQQMGSAAAGATQKHEEVSEDTFGPDGYEIIEIIKHRALNNDSSEIDEAEEVMEFIGQHYGIDFEFGAGPSRQAEAKADKDYDGDGEIESGEEEYKGSKDKAIKAALKESVKSIITKVLEEQMINEAATNELARLADEYAGFEGMKSAILDLQNIVTDIESYYDKTREKIQKVYDTLGEIRNEEGLKVGGFLAPAIESAFNKDLRPVAKQGFTKGLETPKVKTLSQADIDAARAAGDIEEEPKQTLFTPVNENEK